MYFLYIIILLSIIIYRYMKIMRKDLNNLKGDHDSLIESNDYNHLQLDAKIDTINDNYYEFTESIKSKFNIQQNFYNSRLNNIYKDIYVLKSIMLDKSAQGLKGESI